MQKNRIQFIDKIKIFIKAGNGGNGCVSFSRTRKAPKGGPDGGNGGNGADIIFIASKHERSSLIKLKLTPHITAPSGAHGKGSNLDAANQQTLQIPVPIGTQIFDEKMNQIADLDYDTAAFLIAKGGKGGKGNTFFKTAQNQAPIEYEAGELGEQKVLFLQLKITADIGIIGMPNAGKSSLLSAISNARPEIADYPFTTINPQLGTVLHNNNSITFIDIPGLIKNAHQNKGLGHAFLAHIEKCTALIHLLDITSNPLQAYQTVRNELAEYSPQLLSKPTLIVLNKIDCIDSEQINVIKNDLEAKLQTKIITISAKARLNLTELLNDCSKTLKNWDTRIRT